MLSALSPTASISLTPLVGSHCRLPQVVAPRPRRPSLPRLHILACSAPSSPIAASPSTATKWPLSATDAELSGKKRLSPEPFEQLDDRVVKAAKVVKRVRFIVPSKPPAANLNNSHHHSSSPSPLESETDAASPSTASMRSPPSPLRSVDAQSASLLTSMQSVKLRSASPPDMMERPPLSSSTSSRPSSPVYNAADSTSASSSASSSRHSSPQRLPSVLQLKRGNPKGLQLSLGASSFHNGTNASTISGATPISPSLPTSTQTPATPGPPKTPHFNGSGSLGSRTGGLKTGRRPSLLSLITHPPGAGTDPVPPTPTGVPFPYGSVRTRHNRMRSTGSCGVPTAVPEAVDPRTSQSACPLPRPAFSAIDEYASSSGASSGSRPGLSMSPSMTVSSADSIASTPSSTPPLLGSSGSEREFPLLMQEPYADGPIEIVPGVWLGAEESVFYWDVWTKPGSEVGVVNVAQEIDNPFDPSTDLDNYGWTSPRGKEKVTLTEHQGTFSRPPIAYTHLRWSHGEGGLAEIPADAELRHIVDSADMDSDEKYWRFWEAIRWMELRRRAGIPIIIHCQCGVSRSATLTVAYVMALAASGQFPELLGGLHTMQDAYDFVKSKSPWIGPNVSLVFQLVEFARNLSSLLSRHVSANGRSWETKWPTLVDIETEDAWAKRREAFAEESLEHHGDAKEEARQLDEAMLERRARAGVAE